MILKRGLLIIFLLMFLAGCETAKGFKQDVQNTWQNLKKADSWFKEHLW